MKAIVLIGASKEHGRKVLFKYIKDSPGATTSGGFSGPLYKESGASDPKLAL